MQEFRVTYFRCAIASLAMGCMPLLTGCGSKSEYEFAPVSGVITLDGKPVPYTRITLTPQNTQGVMNPGPGSTAMCNDDGTYTLKTARGDQDGAVVGGHTVRISSHGLVKPAQGDRDTGPPPKEIFPERFNEKSELTLTVPAGGTTTADFKLTTKP